MKIISYGASFTVSTGKGGIRLDFTQADSVFLRNLPATKFQAMIALLDSGSDNITWDGVNINSNEYT